MLRKPPREDGEADQLLKTKKWDSWFFVSERGFHHSTSLGCPHLLERRRKHIPEEILFEILVRLPVKSLLRFRCVCKSWNTLISSPDFRNAHLEKNIMRDSYDYVLIRTANYRFSLSRFSICIHHSSRH
ncbi:hypothetical protein DVH24_035456 [Malus domestica]|uniref:F-box domain-containing protein n=1 Tax=Malus domestica TaxID=3750 RepID=A0A498JA54_MALDO|nr:hypothetical protein DVH24_035456 [Malus domestica]